jgi:hypothetical protein
VTIPNLVFSKDTRNTCLIPDVKNSHSYDSRRQLVDIEALFKARNGLLNAYSTSLFSA